MPRHGEGLAPRSLTRFESWDIVFRKTLRNREFGSVEQYCTCTSCTCTVHPVMYWFYLFPVDYQVPYAGNKDKRVVCPFHSAQAKHQKGTCAGGVRVERDSTSVSSITCVQAHATCDSGLIAETSAERRQRHTDTSHRISRVCVHCSYAILFSKSLPPSSTKHASLGRLCSLDGPHGTHL